MNEDTRPPEGARVMPPELQEAFTLIASYGAGQAAVAVELGDGRTMMVESRTFDVTGWEEER